jgi:hypothetical protein
VGDLGSVLGFTEDIVGVAGTIWTSPLLTTSAIRDRSVTKSERTEAAGCPLRRPSLAFCLAHGPGRTGRGGGR